MQPAAASSPLPGSVLGQQRLLQRRHPGGSSCPARGNSCPAWGNSCPACASAAAGTGGCRQPRSRGTHGRADGAEGHQALDVVGVAAAPGVPARVLSPLQDELLPAEAGVLVTDPAAKTEQGLPGLPASSSGHPAQGWHQEVDVGARRRLRSGLCPQARVLGRRGNGAGCGQSTRRGCNSLASAREAFSMATPASPGCCRRWDPTLKGPSLQTSVGICFPSRALWLSAWAGITLGCQRTSPAGCPLPNTSFLPYFLITAWHSWKDLNSSCPNQAEPTWLWAGLGAVACALFGSLYTENKEVRGMPPPRRMQFAHSHESLPSTCPHPGHPTGCRSLLGTSPYRDWGRDIHS